MALSKTQFFYKVIHEAIEAFGERHHITARQHFAPLLGYKGQNGTVQLGTSLNYITYNPANPKALSVDQLLVVMDECEDDREIIIDAICKRYGGQYVRDKKKHEADEQCVKDDLMRISYLAGNLSNMFLEYKNNDGMIDENEANDLEKLAHKTRQQLKVFEDHIEAIKQSEQE